MAGEETYGLTVLHDANFNFTTQEKNHSSSVVLFDLVAIHGLNGDAIDTWTHQKTRVMWLKDLLPEALPNIRIMTFGYNARFKNFTAQQDLRSISSKLLNELVDFRTTEEEKSRPIVFVCHSLGGIVAKKALLIGCSEEQEQVQRSVYGVLFLGTPHNGSSLAVMGKLMANIVSACSPMRPPRTLIGVLQKDSQALLEITEDFCKRRNKVKLISFYELELTSIGPFLRKLIVKQQSALLNVPHEIAIPQFADHRNIVRFTSLQDRTFRPVLRRLQKLAQDFQGGSTAQSTSAQELVLAIPFDITTLPCPSFCGRDDVLEIMKTFFYGDPSESPTRRTFALCGLALHYVLQTRSQYKSGVALMNAASVASLEADFDRLHNLLKLGESKNKINSVRSWLSRAENSQWLLVFDNVDDLSSVPIRKYLPAVNWGHVIFTTRDQGIIGEIAQEGHVLKPLTTEDAAQLLLERSGVRHATDNEMEEARDIADLLGSLPLALVHAGAFLRSRHRTLGEYHQLYKTRRNELLRFSTRLGDTNQAILTAWEINFKQAEQESPAATNLLLLFSFLDQASIPELMLHRGSSPQKR
ncbi:Protein SERAC1 [Penicillium chrysogenum]|nr:Protein SERAC1 [Penicillium chrysogenum]